MISADLGPQLESFVAKLVETGRYNSRSEVLREGIRLIQEREARFSVLDLALARGLEIAEMQEAWPIVPRYEHHRIRRRVHGRYLAFYRAGQQGVGILHILNEAMEYEAILSPEG
jgi:antitoxin ParD1/3/4